MLVHQKVTSSNMPMDNIPNIPFYGFSNWNLQLGRFSMIFPAMVRLGHPEKGQVARGAFDGILG